MPEAAVLELAKTEPFFGEILDADGHTYAQPAFFQKEKGDSEEVWMAFLRRYTTSDAFRDERARNREQLWHVKGIGALGAYDAAERIEAFNLMGVKAQLLFPSWTSNDENIEFQRLTNGRGRAAVQVDMKDPVQSCRELDRCIKLGALHLNLPCGDPPGGVSPAHEMWDPFWARCQEADIAVTLHLACSGLLTGSKPMFPSRAWGDAATLRTNLAEEAGEEAVSPWFMMVAHMGAEVYLQAMVMGGVFERFPHLRFGLIELGAKWVGPCVERMDLWTNFMAKVGRTYPMKPSEYVKRNVRVTPFWNEDLPLMIERYGLAEVYCFSTDYPHPEGGRDPIGKFRKHLAKLPEDYARKFMIENAKLLFPGL